MTRLNRRQILQTSAASVAMLATPSLIKAAGTQGELNLFGWGGYPWEPIYDAFKAETGITVNLIGQPNTQTMLAQVKLAIADGGGDLCEPVQSNMRTCIDQGLIQPFDSSRIDYTRYLDGMPGTKEGDESYYEGQQYTVPVIWGTQGMIFAEGDPNSKYGVASLDHLFAPEYKGKLNIANEQMLISLGRIMDRDGQLPRPFLDSYESEEGFKAVYDAILPRAIELKSQVGQFFASENDAIGGFLANGCTIGLNWQSTGQYVDDEGFDFVAPKEGAAAWCEVLMLMKNARNVDQAYEYIRFLSTPKIAAQYSEVAASNPVAKGSVEEIGEKARDFFQRAYPEDATSKLWWTPGAQGWFTRLQGEYLDKWLSA
ncbi:MAG: extracellular solute-binding protein [Pseudodonghicola sp.]